MFIFLFVLYLQAKKSYERALKLENEFGEYFTAVVQVQFAFDWGQCTLYIYKTMAIRIMSQNGTMHEREQVIVSTFQQ